MIDYQAIIERFYDTQSPLYEVLMTHSEQVAQLADVLCDRLIEGGTPVDADFVHEAAMLHDIGQESADKSPLASIPHPNPEMRFEEQIVQTELSRYLGSTPGRNSSEPVQPLPLLFDQT